MRGCEVLSKLTESDYIVGYVEHGRAEGTCYLMMDYIEAENLKELYARQDPLLAEHAAQILIDSATALSPRPRERSQACISTSSRRIFWQWRTAAVRLIDFDMAQPIPEKPVKFSKIPALPATWRQSN